MTLYVPSGSEVVIAEKYLRKFWSESCGYNNITASYNCSIGRFRRTPEPGWHPDPNFKETGYCCGGHGGCEDCIMVLSQVLANYNTEVTFITTPHGAHIFIDGIKWWQGAITSEDGATFIGVSPSENSVPHIYELRKNGYRSAFGTFDLLLETPITITRNLEPLGIKSISIVSDKTTCIEPCDINIEVTWENDSATAIEFTPSLLINENLLNIEYLPEILPAVSIVTHTFLVLGLMKGTHVICASPNGGTSCLIINIETAPKYRCVNGTCIRDDINGTYLEPTCNNECIIIEPTQPSNNRTKILLTLLGLAALGMIIKSK